MQKTGLTDWPVFLYFSFMFQFPKTVSISNSLLTTIPNHAQQNVGRFIFLLDKVMFIEYNPYISRYHFHDLD